VRFAFRLVLALTAIGAVACAGTAVAPSPSPSASPTPAASPANDTAAERFEVVGDRSQVEVRVREQLASLPAPNDAVLTTSGVSGSFLLRVDGTFADESKIVVDLNGLQSDESRRDNFIKNETLETRRYPNAEFVPKRLEGAPAPLPANGEWTIRIVGDLTIRDVTKEVTWEGTARREGDEVTADARLVVKFGDFGLEIPRVASVLSVVDEIRMQARITSRVA
jgi:polyisoprenoid-binding protein YceI